MHKRKIKIQKQILIGLGVSVLLGFLTFSFATNKSFDISQESLQKLENLNKKYSAQRIGNIFLEDKSSRSSQFFANTLSINSEESSQTDKKLLFKIKDSSESIENIFEISLPPETKKLEEIAQEYKESIEEFEFVEPDYELEINEIEEEFEILSEDPVKVKRGKDNRAIIRSKVRYWPIVAVLDTGTDIFHQSIRENRWSNRGEIYRNSKDDDGNQFTDDKYGWDFSQNGHQSYKDTEGHGTHIGGIISSRTGSLIMPIKVMHNKKGNLSNVIKGIKYAVDNNADVINFSIGTTKKSNSLKTAIKYADSKGIVLVAAAGNKGDNSKYYPAAYSEVIGVGALNKSNNRLDKSNYGDWVDVYTPGKSVYSTLPKNKFGYKSGTSQAAAFATATIAQIKARKPFFDNKMVKEELQKHFPYKEEATE